MKRQRYYPSRIADQIPWLQNFQQKLPGYQVLLKLELAKVDAGVASCGFLIYVLSQWLPAARAFSPAATEALDLLLEGPQGPAAVVLPTFDPPTLPTGVAAVPGGVLPRLFDLVEDIKKADTFTEIIGQDLGVIGSLVSARPSAPQAKVHVMAGPNNQIARIVFTKYDHMGVYIESRRNGGPFEFLAIDTEAPYMDERLLLVAGAPEVREYRLRYWDKGTPNGEWSDVIKVIIGPS